MGGRGAAQTQARQDCEQRLGVRRRPASPSSFARSYRHTPDPPPIRNVPLCPHLLNSHGKQRAPREAVGNRPVGGCRFIENSAGFDLYFS